LGSETTQYQWKRYIYSINPIHKHGGHCKSQDIKNIHSPQVDKPLKQLLSKSQHLLYTRLFYNSHGKGKEMKKLKQFSI
jgi:hypothetical protein